MKYLFTAIALVSLIFAGCQKDTTVSAPPEEEVEETDPPVTDTTLLMKFVQINSYGGTITDSVQSTLYQLPADVGRRYLGIEQSFIDLPGVNLVEYKLNDDDQLLEIVETAQGDPDPANSYKTTYTWAGDQLVQSEVKNGTGKVIYKTTYQYQTVGAETFIRVTHDRDSQDQWDGDHLVSSYKYETVFVVASANFKPLRLEEYHYSYNHPQPQYPQSISRDTMIATLTITDQGNLDQIVFQVSNTDSILTNTDQGWQGTGTRDLKRITGNYVRDNGKTGMGYFIEKISGKKMLPFKIFEEVDFSIAEADFTIPYMLSNTIRFLDYVGEPAKTFFTTLNSVTDTESRYNFENTYDPEGRLLSSTKTDEDEPDGKSTIRLRWPDK